MKRSRESTETHRTNSTIPRYHTFPTPPPKSRGRPPASPCSSTHQDGALLSSYNCDTYQDAQHGSPLLKRQLAVLAFIALAEQTALNSISPYLPEMTGTFPEVTSGEIGLYVGLIASSFALAQFATNFFWGWLSDRIGRKPVIMIGTFCTAASFFAFGFCRTLWQAVFVQAMMGLMNGNQGIVSTCLGEITDRSNQSKSFVYLPVIYGIGAITGPAVGGLLVLENRQYPYLLPNLFAAGILLVDLVITGTFLDESLEEAKDLPPLKKRVGTMFAWLWQFTGGARHPTYLRRSQHHSHLRVHGTASPSDSTSETENEDRESLLDAFPILTPQNDSHLTTKELLNRDTLLLLVTYLMFQFSNISFNSLFPIFASAPVPTGRRLSPEEIGVSLSLAGIVTIVFQVGVFGRLKEKMGNKATYRAGLLISALSMWLMPWVGYRNSSPPFHVGSGKWWLWLELGFVLLLKTVAAVSGLTSALLLITNSAPSNGVLGTLNGLAQTLSAAGRAAGPFLSGALFSISTRIKDRGELLAWGVFGGVALVGWALSFGIRGRELESGSWNGSESHADDMEEECSEDSNSLDGSLGKP